MPIDSCSRSGDYIAVHDGTDVTANRLRIYCGEADDVSVTSSADRLFVEFVSDERGEAQGFSASFKYLPTGVGRPPPVIHHRKTTTTGRWRWRCIARKPFQIVFPAERLRAVGNKPREKLGMKMLCNEA
jgi:CUB domain